jgi:CheY-like chemotaxis protein
MPKTVVTYSLLVSCPSDVQGALEHIEKAVSSFNRGFGESNGIRIDTRHWSKDAYANIVKGKSAQDELNDQIVDDADMVVAVFWSRFGSPTKTYGSGTEEEIERMLDNGKPVMLYFIDRPLPMSLIDGEQITKIQEFKKRHQNDGLYVVLQDEAELALRLRDELEQRFLRMRAESGVDAAKGNKAEPKRKPKAILWVDDHPENNTYGMRYFQDNGIEVAVALSTEQALSLTEHNSYAVIVSDVCRREGPREGYVLLDALRERGDSTPFIVFSGFDSLEDKLETKKHGGDGYTCQFEELFVMVSAVILRMA